MIFEFTAKPDFDFITDFSKKFNLPVRNNRLSFPRSVGDGYIRKLTFGDDFRLLIHRYKLTEDFTIIRNPSPEPNDLISIFFYNNEQPIDLFYNKENPVKFSQKNESAIQVTTSDLNSIIRFPANSETYYIVVGITAGKLASFLNIKNPNTTLQKMISGDSSFLYFESMNTEIQQILKHVSSVNMTDPLSHFYVQVKIQELLYILCDRLVKRENTLHRNINNADAQKLVILRNLILADLSQPPVLSTLAATIAMSETKMKQLFKQTYGDTIYNFFQKIRMEEAAFLLKQGSYSVSETGYHLGFSNLSHFGRLFEKHYGITPKKYSSVG